MNKDFRLDDSLRGFCAKGCGRQDKQLNTYDYLADVPGNAEQTDLVEVQFKNTRKGYFRNDNRLPLEKGDMVAVEASPGHDIGVVTLTGRLVPLQMKKANFKANTEIKRIYRKARPVDIEKYEEAKTLEQETMIRSRQIAKELELDMKIGDVEYQGDGNKAIFYYIADARVDFRKLIKVLAEAFHVRIEMRQIGARQEAGRTRFQDISPNPQKLAGQCAKLKCCLNYEVDTYVEAFRRLPSREVQLETADGTFYYFKADILSNMVTYSTDKRMAANTVTISAARAFEVIQLNKQGEKPLQLDNSATQGPVRPLDLAEQDDLTRFDKERRRKNSGKKKRQQRNGRPQNEGTRERTERPQREQRSRGERPQRGDSPQKERRGGEHNNRRQGGHQPNEKQQ